MADRTGSLTMPQSPPRLALSGGEWLAVVVAVGIAHAFYARSIAFPSAFDATKYLEIASDIRENGLFSEFHYAQLRTYGYPLLLRLLLPVAETVRLPWTFVVYVAQLVAHVAATLFLRAQLMRIDPATARIATIAIVANPIALVYVADTLTESVSLTLLVVMAGFAAKLFAGTNRRVAAIVGGGLAVGFAIAVRPANLFALTAWIAVVIAAAWLQRWTKRKAVAALIIAAFAIAVPLVPQVVNNVRHFDRFTPLVAADLGRYQQIWGIANLKYATALWPLRLPSVFYENPFAEGRPVDEERPLAWYVDHPLVGVATIGLHVFGMLDQDLLFTYARDLDPWYRRPLAVVVQGMVAVSVLTLWLLLRRRPKAPMATAALAGIVAFVVSHVGLHGTTAVEMRFGLPPLVLAGVLSGVFAHDLWPSLSRRARVACVALTIAWIAVSMPLSDWLRAQSPQIRAWQAAGGPP